MIPIDFSSQNDIWSLYQILFRVSVLFLVPGLLWLNNSGRKEKTFLNVTEFLAIDDKTFQEKIK